MKSFNQYNVGWFDKKEKEDPDHPYCTNWPVNKKKGENEKV